MVFMEQVFEWLQQGHDCISWQHDPIVGDFILIHKEPFSILAKKSVYNVRQTFCQRHLFNLVTPQLKQYNERQHFCLTSTLLGRQSTRSDFEGLQKRIKNEGLQRAPHKKGKRSTKAAGDVLSLSDTAGNNVSNPSQQRHEEPALTWTDTMTDSFDEPKMSVTIEDDDTMSMTDIDTLSQVLESPDDSATEQSVWNVETEDVIDNSFDMHLDEVEGVRPRLCSFDTILEDIAQTAKV